MNQIILNVYLKQKQFLISGLRGIWLCGCVLLSESEGISRLVYILLCLCMSVLKCAPILTGLYLTLFGKIWKELNMWKEKLLLEPLQNVLDFSTLNIIFKINWIKHCLSQSKSIWFYIPNLFFKSVVAYPFSTIMWLQIQ